MMATVSAKFVAPAKAQVATRRQAVVCQAVQQQQEAQPRRAALALMAAAVFGLGATAAEAASPAPKNSSVASSEGYNMEGTKKQGISAKRKKALLKKLRANAEKAAK